MNNNRLKYIRDKLELTQKEVGKDLSSATSTVAGWENGHDPIPLKKLVAFANKYKYSLDYITGLSDENNYVIIRKLDKERVGKNLKSLRKTLNLTETKMALECSIAQTTYSNYETGRNLITGLTLYTLCLKHHLSMDNFLNR